MVCRLKLSCRIICFSSWVVGLVEVGPPACFVGGSEVWSSLRPVARGWIEPASWSRHAPRDISRPHPTSMGSPAPGCLVGEVSGISLWLWSPPPCIVPPSCEDDGSCLPWVLRAVCHWSPETSFDGTTAEKANFCPPIAVEISSLPPAICRPFCTDWSSELCPGSLWGYAATYVVEGGISSRPSPASYQSLAALSSSSTPKIGSGCLKWSHPVPCAERECSWSDFVELQDLFRAWSRVSPSSESLW